jgi:hypothetical protein
LLVEVMAAPLVLLKLRAMLAVVCPFTGRTGAWPGLANVLKLPPPEMIPLSVRQRLLARVYEVGLASEPLIPSPQLPLPLPSAVVQLYTFQPMSMSMAISYGRNRFTEFGPVFQFMTAAGSFTCETLDPPLNTSGAHRGTAPPNTSRAYAPPK